MCVLCAPLIHWCQSIILMEFFFSSLSFFFQQSSRTWLYIFSRKRCVALSLLLLRGGGGVSICNRTSAALIFSVVTCYFLFLKSNNIRSIPRAQIFFFLYSIHNVARAIDLCFLSHTVPIICTAAVRYSFGRGKKKYWMMFQLFFF